MNQDIKVCQPDVEISHGLFNRALSFTQNFSDFGKNLKHKLSLVNVKLLGSSYLLKLTEVFNENNCVHDFFRRERMVSKLYGSGFYLTKIVIKKHHVELLKQVLDHKRSDWGMGRIFLFQAITSDVIVSSYVLSKVLDNQVSPKTEILLDVDNALYSFPYYNRIEQHSLTNYNSVRYSRKEIPKMEEKLNVTKGINDKTFDFMSFLCDSRDVTFGEFLESPSYDFSRDVKVKGFADDDGEIRFEEMYDAQRWFVQYSELFESDSVLGLYRHEIMVIVDCVIGMYSSVMEANLVSGQKWRLSIQEFNHYLVTLNNNDRAKVSKVLSRLSNLMMSCNLDLDLMFYYCYYLLLNNSSSEVNELLDVFDDQDNQIFFLKHENLKKIMGYYTSERTMSLDMWVVLNDLTEESV